MVVIAMAALATFVSSLGNAGTVSDAGGGTVKIADTSRILSIGGDVTEIIYALGLAERIVAVDTTSTYPPEALKEKASVGYMRALSSESVLSVAPTVIFASERSGPPEVIRTLKSTSVTYVEVPDKFSPEGVADKIRMIGVALNAEAKAEDLAKSVETQFNALQNDRVRIKRAARALFVLSVQNGRVVAGGTGTTADAILKLAGAENAAHSVRGFRPLSDEAIIELAPDVLVAMSGAGPGSGHEVERVFSIKSVASTPAGMARRLFMLDGQYLLGFGPRAPAAARDLMNALYPDMANGTK
jgi:iron complex transport system substrate-binding protein